jgi:alpha/beta superfamily hydrolase
MEREFSAIRHGTFPGPAGQLEYILNESPSDVGLTAAVVAHPHPLYRGTMHTRIVFHTAKVLAELGMPVLRFHFRGVGLSQGVYDHGRGEMDDLRAAMAHMRGLYPRPLLLAGFSFGASTVAKLLAAEAREDVVQAVLLGLPVESSTANHLSPHWAWKGPKLMISGDHDQFASVAALEAWFAQLDEPKQRIWIEGGDHFLNTRMDEYRAALAGALS